MAMFYRVKFNETVKASLALACLPLLITACTPTLKIKCDLPAEIQKHQAEFTDKPSEKLSLAIKLDATPSMAGFVATPKQSRYEQTLDLLDVVASASWSRDKSTLDYYRFGTRSEKIDKATYIDAKLPGFYQKGGNFVDSQVKAAIDNPSPEKLSVIVTDLYQTDTDITSVIKQFKQYLQKDLAIGVLGVKSEFKGWVYDIGTRKAKRYYDTSNKKPQQLRPFYVIFLGKYGDVLHFFTQLQEKNPELVGNNFIIFYPKIVKKTAFFDIENYPPEFPRSKTIRKVSSLNIGTIKATIDQGALTPGILLTGDSPEKIQFTIPYYAPPYILPIDTDKKNAFLPEIEVLVPSQDKSNLEAAKVNQEALRFSDWKLAEQPDIPSSAQKLDFTIDIDAKSIKDGVSQMNIKLIPNQFKEPLWWQEWNFDERNFDRYSTQNFDGSSTINLQLFLQGIKSSTIELMQEQNTVAAYLCLAFQKK